VVCGKRIYGFFHEGNSQDALVLGGGWWWLVVAATKACGNGRVPDEPWQMMLAGRCVAGDV